MPLFHGHVRIWKVPAYISRTVLLWCLDSLMLRWEKYGKIYFF
jgi:hypothetical protein